MTAMATTTSTSENPLREEGCCLAKGFILSQENFGRWRGCRFPSAQFRRIGPRNTQDFSSNRLSLQSRDKPTKVVPRDSSLNFGRYVVLVSGARRCARCPFNNHYRRGTRISEFREFFVPQGDFPSLVSVRVTGFQKATPLYSIQLHCNSHQHCN